MGIFLVTYSHTTSMLYFSWADIGMTGAPSAIVPIYNIQVTCFFVVFFAYTKEFMTLFRSPTTITNRLVYVTIESCI